MDVVALERIAEVWKAFVRIRTVGICPVGTGQIRML